MEITWMLLLKAEIVQVTLLFVLMSIEANNAARHKQHTTDRQQQQHHQFGTFYTKMASTSQDLPENSNANYNGNTDAKYEHSSSPQSQEHSTVFKLGYAADENNNKIIDQAAAPYQSSVMVQELPSDPLPLTGNNRTPWFNMAIEPMALEEVLEDTNLIARFNCSHGDMNSNQNNGNNNSHLSLSTSTSSSSSSSPVQTFQFTITTAQKRVVIPFKLKETSNSSHEDDTSLSFPVDCSKSPHSFGIHTNTVGRTVLVVQISKSSKSPYLFSTEINVSVIRKVRMPDLAFDCVVPVIMVLISFSMGLVTNADDLKMFREYSVPILLGLLCQFICMPLLSLCIAAIAFNEPDMGLGLLVVAALPGGGGGHLMVAIVEAHIPLSYMLNFTAYSITTVTAPLWVLAMGRFVKSSNTYIPYGKLMFWLFCSLSCYILGLGLRRKWEGIAEAILTWLTKPFLLFASILFVSLGLYINFFMFLVLDVSSLIGMALYPCLAYGAGYLLPYVLKQQPDYTKTIATESAIPNCIVALVIVQYILPQPASDIATIAPILVLIFSPMPFILEYLAKIGKIFVQDKCAKREEMKNNFDSIVASTSLLNVTHMTQLESSSFVSTRNNDIQRNDFRGDQNHFNVAEFGGRSSGQSSEGVGGSVGGAGGVFPVGGTIYKNDHVTSTTITTL